MYSIPYFQILRFSSVIFFSSNLIHVEFTFNLFRVFLFTVAMERSIFLVKFYFIQLEFHYLVQISHRSESENENARFGPEKIY